jgi:SPP1 family holin
MSKETIVRAIALALSTVNAVLVMVGVNPLPYSDTEIYAAVSAVAEVALVIWAWWRNNSVSKAAQAADDVLGAIKDGALDAEQVERFITLADSEPADGKHFKEADS